MCGGLLTASGKSQAWPHVIHFKYCDSIGYNMHCTVLVGNVLSPPWT